MSKNAQSSTCVEDMSLLARRQYLRGLCPCRTNSSSDIEGWRKLFDAARFGSFSERKAAAHSIGTLVEKAQTVPEYRELLCQLQPHLDALMEDPKSASQVLGVMKKHGHAHKGAARKNYRRAYAVFAMHHPDEVAQFLNTHLALRAHRRVTEHSSVVKRLARWLSHRVEFQPTRKTSTHDILQKARQLQPSLFSEQFISI